LLTWSNFLWNLKFLYRDHTSSDISLYRDHTSSDISLYPAPAKSWPPESTLSHHTNFKYPSDITFSVVDSVQTGSGDNPVPCSMGIQGSFPRDKMAGVWRWPVTSIQWQGYNAWTWPLSPVYATSPNTPIFLTFLQDCKLTFWVYLSSLPRVLQQPSIIFAITHTHTHIYM
jgi:hypothetical protein